MVFSRYRPINSRKLIKENVFPLQEKTVLFPSCFLIARSRAVSQPRNFPITLLGNAHSLVPWTKLYTNLHWLCKRERYQILDEWIDRNYLF